MPGHGRQVRGPGDGTYSLRKDGRWEVRVFDPITGKRRSAYAKTEAAARKKLREMVTRKESGEIVLDRGTSFEDYSQKWLAGEGLKGRRESTVREYRHRLETYVLPLIGRRKLGRLTVADVEYVLDEAAKRGLSKSTLQGLRNAMSAVLNDAMRSLDLRSNVARLARLPEVAPRKAKASATLEEVGTLLSEAEGNEMYELLVLVAFTGCRIGEALGSKWADFDLDAGTWQLSRTTTLNLAGKVVIGDRTKYGESRLVHLPERVVAALRSQGARVAAVRLKHGKLWQDNDLVFPTNVGTPQDARNLRKGFRVIAKRAGYRHSFHELRHVFATIAASEVTETSLAKVMGHRKVSTTTDLYAHLYEPDGRRVTKAVSDALKSKKSS